MAGNAAFLGPFKNGAGFDFPVTGHLICGEPLVFHVFSIPDASPLAPTV